MRSGKISLGHPIDVATGIMFATYEDVVLPGRMQLSWSRQYSTALLTREPGPLGSGWITPYGCHLMPYAGGFQLLGPEGDLQIFEGPEGILDRGGVLRALGSFQELAREDSHFVVTRWSASGGGALRFSFAALWPNSPLPLVSIENWNGGALDLLYDTSKRLVRVQQRRERRALELEYDSSGLLAEVTILTAGGKRFAAAQYQYDERSRLAEARAVSGHPERYAYEMGGKMVREMRRDGGVFSFEYDSAGRCVHTSGLDHYDEKIFRYHDQANWTEVTDSLGNSWRYQRNEQGQIVKSLSPCGAVTEREYDQEGRIRAVTDPRGGITEHTFDQQGDRIGIRLPDGREWKSGFNARHQFLNVTTPAGAIWTFEYDKIGRLEHVVHPAGLEWFHFWSADDLAATTNNNGAVWRYEWDEFGQMRRVATAQGTAVQRDYDELGFCTRIVDSRHGESQFEWNPAGQMVRSKNAAGLTTGMFYDGAGNLIQAGNQITGFTRYRYGRCCGELLEKVSPSGAVVRYKWSTEPGRLDSITDPNGNDYVFEYNEDGYLIRERFPSGRTGRTLVYSRNLAGDVSEKTNGAGETTQFERDTCGRVLAAAFFDGSRVEFNYENGKLTSATNDSGAVRFERDAHGRRTKEEFGQYTIQSVYDFSGNRITRLSNVGAHNSFNFDEHGRLRKLALSPTASLEMEYDAAGREIRRLLPGNTTLSNSFDHAGRLLNQRVEHEPFLAGYKTQPHTLIDRTYKYDLIGRLSRVVDASGVFSSFSYDQAGHLETHETTSLYEVFAYDGNGNISSSERHSVLPSSVGEDFQERREIGPGDRLAHAGNRSYAYDADDRLISKTEELADGTTRQWTYEWNALGLLAAVVRPDGQRWTYTYDALGRRIRKQSEGIDIHYVWDGNAILHELDGQSGRVGTWTFSPRSFVPLAYQENEKLALPITDSLGTPREFVDETGRIVWSARYLAYGETQSLERGEIDNPVRFQGQWFDAETGLHYNNLRYYDPQLGRYLSMDPVPLAGGLNGYAYGPDPINFIDPFGLDPEYYPLDGQNRPTGAFADLSKSDLRSTGSSPPTVDPPGWQGGEHPYHQQRSHLIADTLGGSGDDPRNLVTLTDGSNHPGMSSQEAQIRNYLKNNPDGRVLLEVTAEYDGENPRPTAVRMYAINENGETIVDERIENGRRQKLKSNCCAAS